TERPFDPGADIESMKFLPRLSAAHGRRNCVDSRALNHRSADYSDIARLGTVLRLHLIGTQIYRPKPNTILGIKCIQRVMLSRHVDYVMRTLAGKGKRRNV